MFRVRNVLSVLAMVAMLVLPPRLAHAQDYNDCWSTCHTGAMSIMEIYGQDAATEWFHGCINELCSSLDPI